MGLESDCLVYLSGIMDPKKNDTTFQKEFLDFVESKGGVKCVNAKENFGVKRILDDEKNGSTGPNDIVEEMENGVVEMEMELDSSLVDEDSASRKRKRECDLGMLNWVANVAKDPCDVTIGSLPERHKWKYCGNNFVWKQVLMFRGDVLVKGNVDSSPQQSVWQKKQKMHPSMYDDPSEAEVLRSSQRLQSAKNPTEKNFSESSSSGLFTDEDYMPDKSNSTADSLGYRRRKKIPVSPFCQADIPDLDQEWYESESKWLGTRTWPLEKREQTRGLIERDPVGRGRQDSCGCQFPGSENCVRFHVNEKRSKVKLELGPAFYRWGFDSMGEEVALSWTNEEEDKFQSIVEKNPLSRDKYFWNELFKFFPSKGRKALLKYYFNVFLLRHRGNQNRNDMGDIDSDEELDCGPVGNRFGQVVENSAGSIVCSPKKPQTDM